MEPIAPLTSSPILGSSTSDTGGQQQQPSLFHEGQTFHAQVLAAAEDDTFILDLGTRKLLARGDSVTLKPGLSLALKVTTTHPVVELKILSAPLQQYLGRSLTAINQNINLTELQGLLQQTPAKMILDTLSPATRDILQNFWMMQQPPPPGAEGEKLLRQMIKTLGLHTESRLAAGTLANEPVSLKSALLEVIAKAGDNEDVKEAGKTLVATVEGFQLSQLRLAQDQTLILPLPFPFLDQGYLLIEQPTDQGEEGDQRRNQQNFSLHLALSGLGDLQINFLLTPDGLWMRFNCDSQEKADFVGQYADELKAQLEDIPLQGLSFAATAGNPGAELIKKLMPKGQSLLNTRA